jgi:hypothetical protein
MTTVGWMFKPGDGRKMLKEMNKEKSDFLQTTTQPELP